MASQSKTPSVNAKTNHTQSCPLVYGKLCARPLVKQKRPTSICNLSRTSCNKNRKSGNLNHRQQFHHREVKLSSLSQMQKKYIMSTPLTAADT